MSAWLQRLKRDLKAEKRKAGTLAALALVALLLWGKLLIPTGPQHAAGQNAAAGQPGAASGGNAGQREPILEPPERPVVRVRLPDRVRQNPFRVPRDRYRRVEPKNEKPNAAQMRQRRQRRRTIRDQAEKLTLQSTLIGQQPTAIINGQPVAPGQTIDGFRVLEVEARKVRLKKQDVEITLRLEPG